MLPLWLIVFNYYIASFFGIVGNALVIVLSFKIREKEINTYKWIINSQAVLEITACISAVLMKSVSFSINV